MKIVLSVEENINKAGAVANAGTAATFKITDAKLYVPVVNLSTKDNVAGVLLEAGDADSRAWTRSQV